jgi:hypothetical protein
MVKERSKTLIYFFLNPIKYSFIYFLSKISAHYRIKRLFSALHACVDGADALTNKGNNKITELRTILQRESQNS